MDEAKPCGGCGTLGEDLKRCAKCKSEYYCSRDCQKKHWKVHKKICGKSSGASPSNAPATFSDKPFHSLHAKTWLHGHSEADTFRLLIDTYRLRAHDNYQIEGKTDAGDVLGGAGDSSGGFNRFLTLATAKQNLLPSWWTPEKAQECVSFGMDTEEWQSLRKTITKADVIDHYGDSLMPMQLRLFGEQIYGTGPGGQPGKTVMTMMMAQEAGGAGFMSHLGLG
ncbi:hypothetical protein TWF730_006164 [Orbilia blumenaviensis]|uniref:MYND-type domain-containing protein n=1 Tax=Orbilia blumenaviensis TaxID=1796055 RepID=A0AAV9TW41_9PEZI